MKKISLILLAVIVAAALMMIPVFATTSTGGAAASEVAGTVGQTADVIIRIYGFADVEGLALEYQLPEGLTMESAAWLCAGDMDDVDTETKRAVWAKEKGADMTEATQVFRMTVRIDESGLDPQNLQKEISLRVIVDSIAQGRKEFPITATIRILIPAKDVTLNQQALTLDLVKNQTATLNATVSPSYTTDLLTWSSDNEQIVQVVDGKLTAKQVGTAKITVTAGDASATCVVTVTCSHSGGTATCTKKATCDVCGATYGEYGQHTAEPHWVQNSETHVQIYGCCNTPAGAEEAHDWGNGGCEICGATCPHEGGTATCSQQAICTQCGNAYGQLSSEHSQASQWQNTATHHSQVYPCCGKVEIEEAAHNWQDGVCADCEAICAHTGGQATCLELAVCTICGESYGQLDAENHAGQAKWRMTSLKHSRVYDCCQRVAVEETDHNWNNGICADCNFGCSHSGGEATCIQKAICAICGEAYGQIDATNHTNTEISGKVEETCDTPGYTGDIYCFDCQQQVQFGQEIPATGNHVDADGLWNFDENGHFHLCEYGTKFDMETHTGGNATCTQLAICQICQQAYGSVAADHHVNTEIRNATAETCKNPGYTGDTYCLDCQQVIASGEEIPATGDHVDADGLWNFDENGHFHLCACGTVFDAAQHTGGRATCQQAAICEYCGTHYGDPNAANHTGGLATCASKAICADCGKTYGKVNPHYHTGKATWTKTETSHRRAYTCCGLELIPQADHTWEGGVCGTCLYVCHHTGGQATCTQKAICENCGTAYGELNADRHSGTAQWIQTETTHSQRYDCCDLEVVAQTAHTFENGLCSVCAYGCQHTGGNATCTQLALCETCGTAYGELKADQHTAEALWTTTETLHTLAYPCCGLEVVKETSHVWQNGTCVSCQYICVHTGGEATCTQKAVCETCGTAYGELKADHHTEEPTWIQTETQHSKIYPCCQQEAEAAAAHVWENGSCQICAYACKHEMGTELQGAFAETCYKPGYTGDRYCTGCAHLVEAGQSIPANQQHTASAQWLSNETHHWHICTVGGCEAIVEQTAHKFQWVVDQAPTDLQIGWKHEVCSDCGFEKEKVEIPMVTHQHTNVTYHAAVEATCVTPGSLAYYTCESAYCTGKYYADEACLLALDTILVPVDADNHVGQTQLQGAIEATCGQDGYSGDLYCLSCNAVISQGNVIPATGLHTPSQTLQSNDTHHYLSCVDCGATVQSQAHSFSWITDQLPTEEQFGKQHQVCDICGFIGQDVAIDKIPHVPAFVMGKAPTCTEDGIADHYFCANCGRYFASQNGGIGQQIQEDQLTLKATGHQYDETWQMDETSHWLICHCGQQSQIGTHTGVLVGAAEATKEQNGYTGDLVCQTCAYLMQKGQVIPSLAQDVVDDILNANPGDQIHVGLPNEAGQVDTQILGQVLQAAAGKDVTLVLDAGDYQWTISGLQIGSANLDKVDLQLKTNTQNIPENLVTSLAGSAPTVEFTVAHAEAFGFLANLTMQVDTQYANAQFALYAYGADGQLTLMHEGQIDMDGNLCVPLSSGGSYLLVIDANSPPTGDTGLVWALACMACATAAVVILKTKKKLF